ncbi:MAG TPA: hypothetical protein VF116_07165 [Ktedonobacterales bacterium]
MSTRIPGRGRSNAPSGRPLQPPPAQPWWRRQIGLLLGVAAGIAVCAVALVVANAITGPRMPPPAPVAAAICADLEHQSYSDLYTRLAPAQRAAGSEQQFVASQQQLDRLRGPVTSCAYTLPSVRDNAATARLTIVRGTEAPTQADVQLGAEDGAWLVESYDTNVV